MPVISLQEPGVEKHERQILYRRHCIYHGLTALGPVLKNIGMSSFQASCWSNSLYPFPGTRCAFSLYKYF